MGPLTESPCASKGRVKTTRVSVLARSAAAAEQSQLSYCDAIIVLYYCALFSIGCQAPNEFKGKTAVKDPIYRKKIINLKEKLQKHKEFKGNQSLLSYVALFSIGCQAPNEF